MDNMKHRRLQEMDRSDFEIVDGEPDIRGWDVRNTAGKKIGEVEDLIIDAHRKKVRYMVVDLDDNELKLDHRKILVPIGLAELHKEDDDVILSNVEASQLREVPEYERNELTPEVEARVCTALGRKSDTMQAKRDTDKDDKFYSHDYFNDDNLYKNRLHEAQPVKKESEYDKGLRLWERRSEGGVIPEKTEEGRNIRSESEDYRKREVEEDRRLEMVRNRRNHYEQKRGRHTDSGRFRDHDHSHRKDNTIEGRIRDEGLQDG
jgi:sporulation protein YlmC with PRC-barrel domain